MDTRRMSSLGLVSALLFLAIPVAAQENHDTRRIRIESADQLPRHTYRVRESATKLVEDDAQYALLAATLEADLRGDLARYEISERSVLKEYFSTLGSLALIEGDYASAIIYADRIRAIEDEPALRMLAGTLERALAEAAAVPIDYQELAFEDAYRKVISDLPYEQVQAELESLKERMELLSASIVMGRVRAEVEPGVRSEISRRLADHCVRPPVYGDSSPLPRAR